MKSFLIGVVLSVLSMPAFATIHKIQVWDGYFQFLPSTLTIQLGDTIDWLPLDQPTMVHTITSNSIPAGAASFDYTWQAPADTFFRYIPTEVGTYNYECTPHVSLNMVASFTVLGTNQIEEVDPLSGVISNPGSGKIYGLNKVVGYEYELVSISGAILRKGVIRDPSMDVNDLPKGMYLLTLVADRKKYVFQFIKA